MNPITASTEIQIRGSPGGPQAMGDAQPVRPTRDGSKQTPETASAPLEATYDEVKQAAEQVNAFLQASGTHVQFELHQETKRMMLEVKDDRTGEVLRTIPSKELLDLSTRIGEMVGVLLDKQG